LGQCLWNLLSCAVAMPDDRKIRVLIVDDEEDFRDIFALLIERMGYQAVTAADGREALTLLETNPCDLALIDFQMPHMNGLELLREVRRTNPKIEVIFITGFGTVPSVVEAMKLGVFDYVTKPLNLDEIEELIHRVVKTRILPSSQQS
jgi:DNA-binding NtrC family response regulator